MKRVLSLLCCAAMVLTMCTFYVGTAAATVSASFDYADTKTNKVDFTGTTYADLVAFIKNADNKGKEIVLQNDVIANDAVFTYDRASGLVIVTKLSDGEQLATIGTGLNGTTIGAVEGSLESLTAVTALTDLNGCILNGNGHSIKGVYTNKSLIETVQVGEGIKNLTINSYLEVKSAASFAMVVNTLYGFAKDVYVSGAALSPDEANGGKRVGGVIGTMRRTNTEKQVAVVDGVTFDGVVSTKKGSGGILAGVVFQNRGGTIINCTNYGDIYSPDGTYATGGVLGILEGQATLYTADGNTYQYDDPTKLQCVDAEIINCSNVGNVYGHNAKTGGIIGYADFAWGWQSEPFIKVHVYACFNSGNVTNGTSVVGAFGRPNGGCRSKNSVFTGVYTTSGVVANSTGGFKIWGNTVKNAVFADYHDHFNDMSSLIPGAKSWNADGTIDQTSARTADSITVTTAQQFTDLMKKIDSTRLDVVQVPLNIELANDIDLNEGYVFGYYADKKAATVTNGTDTWYVGSGYGDLALGTFYTKGEDGSFTATTAPALNPWTPISTGYAWSEENHLGRGYVIDLDGNGNNIRGLYVPTPKNQVSDGVHATTAYDFSGMFVDLFFGSYLHDFELDGLVIGKSGYTGAVAARVCEADLERIINRANDVLTESYDNPGGGDNGGFDIFSIFNINKDFE